MNRNFLATWIVLVLLVISVGCIEPPETPDEPPRVTPPPGTDGEEPPPGADDSGATPEGTGQIVDGNNQFAIDFYNELRSDPGNENLFFSPYSISSAFGMVYEGARGETADEMTNVFYFPEDDDVRRSSTAALYNKLNMPDASYELQTANALWVQQDYELLEEYLNTVEHYYGGKASNVDFVGATEETRQTINTWVEEKTNNKIKDLFPSGSLNSDTRLAITNAVYFKGNWAEQFDPDKTREEDFRVSSEKTVSVPLMHNTADFGYGETEELQILEMPYEGEDLSMLVLLPKDDDLGRAEELLSVEKLEEWKWQIQPQEVSVYLPKFTLKEKYALNNMLEEMGMPQAFTFDADLSGMDGTTELYIQTAVHQSFVDVNEEGTEAAAATGIAAGIEMAPEPPPEFRADHPFIFIIQEKETGAILFMGRLVDPS